MCFFSIILDFHGASAREDFLAISWQTHGRVLSVSGYVQEIEQEMLSMIIDPALDRFNRMIFY